MYVLVSVSLNTHMLHSTCVEIRGQPQSPSSSSALLDTGSLCSPLHLQAGWLPVFRRFSCWHPILQLECSRGQTSAASSSFAWSLSSDRPTCPARVYPQNDLPDSSAFAWVLHSGHHACTARIYPWYDLPGLTFLGTQFWNLLGMGFRELPGYRHVQIHNLNDAIFINSTAYFKLSLDYLWPHRAVT